ncbi:hypothetical protein BH23ACT5_BH23ACT5_01610 [soil metagenome]
MRRFALSALATAVLVIGVWTATAIGTAPNGQGAFVDDDGSVHEPDINGLASSGITRGCNPPADDRFCPTRAVDRQEMATFLTRALGLPRSEAPPFDDTAGSIHAADIDAIAQAGITLGCNPPANTSFCPRQSVTRQQMASFLVRAFEIPQVLNRLSMRSGLSCTKDSSACTGRATLAPGVRLDVVEGWYQVLPYQSGEEAAFTATTTSVAFTWNGEELTRRPTDITTDVSLATRRWAVQPPALTRGTHTLRATWRWTGSVDQTVTYIVTVP